MPAKSENQRRAAGAALAAKRSGSCKSAGAASSRQMCKSMSEKQLKEFATKKKK